MLITRTRYNARGEAIDAVDAKGVATRSKFDDAGRIVRTVQNHSPGSTDPDANLTTELTYNADGRRSRQAHWILDRSAVHRRMPSLAERPERRSMYIDMQPNQEFARLSELGEPMRQINDKTPHRGLYVNMRVALSRGHMRKGKIGQ